MGRGIEQRRAEDFPALPACSLRRDVETREAGCQSVEDCHSAPQISNSLAGAHAGLGKAVTKAAGIADKRDTEKYHRRIFA